MSADEHTFLFCDLVGFTALAEAEGDERAAAERRAPLGARLRPSSCPLGIGQRAQASAGAGP